MLARCHHVRRACVSQPVQGVIRNTRDKYRIKSGCRQNKSLVATVTVGLYAVLCVILCSSSLANWAKANYLAYRWCWRRGFVSRGLHTLAGPITLVSRGHIKTPYDNRMQGCRIWNTFSNRCAIAKKRSCFILIFNCTQVMRHQKKVYTKQI